MWVMVWWISKQSWVLWVTIKWPVFEEYTNPNTNLRVKINENFFRESSPKNKPCSLFGRNNGISKKKEAQTPYIVTSSLYCIKKSKLKLLLHNTIGKMGKNFGSTLLRNKKTEFNLRILVGSKLLGLAKLFLFGTIYEDLQLFWWT